MLKIYILKKRRNKKKQKKNINDKNKKILLKDYNKIKKIKQ